jgi:predicted DNA-binding WGR domain protein
MKRTFTYKDDKSDKFWAIEVQGNEFTVTYGKTGTNGQTQTKTFADAAACKKEADKLIAEKVKKGYAESGGKQPAPESSMPAEKKPDKAEAKPAAGPSASGGVTQEDFYGEWADSDGSTYTINANSFEFAFKKDKRLYLKVSPLQWSALEPEKGRYPFGFIAKGVSSGAYDRSGYEFFKTGVEFEHRFYITKDKQTIKIVRGGYFIDASAKRLEAAQMQQEEKQAEKTAARAALMENRKPFSLTYIDCPTNQFNFEDLSGIESYKNYLIVNQRLRLTLWDMSNPTDIKLINEIPYPRPFWANRLIDNQLIIWGSPDKENNKTAIIVMDISNPQNIKREGEYTLEAGVIEIVKSRGRLLAITSAGICDFQAGKILCKIADMPGKVFEKYRNKKSDPEIEKVANKIMTEVFGEMPEEVLKEVNRRKEKGFIDTAQWVSGYGFDSYPEDWIADDNWMVMAGPHRGVYIFKQMSDGALTLAKHIETQFFMPYMLHWDVPGKSFIICGGDHTILKFDMSVPEKTKRVKGAKTGEHSDLCSQYIRDGNTLLVFGITSSGTNATQDKLFLYEVDVSAEIPEILTKNEIKGFLRKGNSGFDHPRGMVRSGEYLVLCTDNRDLGVMKIS